MAKDNNKDFEEFLKKMGFKQVSEDELADELAKVVVGGMLGAIFDELSGGDSDEEDEPKQSEEECGPFFADLYEAQVNFQKKVLRESGCKPPVFSSELCSNNVKLPRDDVSWFQYHVTAMVEELGEVLAADKRWKTHRNAKFDKAEKVDELADVLITFLNMCIYSGVTESEIVKAAYDKVRKNFARLESENNGK